MEKCEQCGNVSKYWFIVEVNGQRHLFDSFECASFALAPACSHCGCRILGHGVIPSDAAIHGDPEEMEMYCCTNCFERHRAAISAASDVHASRTAR